MTTSKRQDQSGSERFGISAAAQLCGVSQQRLRTWENRYRIVDAERGPNGRRLYSEADLEKLLLIKRLLDAGDVIGEVAELDTKALKQRLKTKAGHAEPGQPVTEKQRYRVAVLGDFVPARLEVLQSWPIEMEFVTKCSSIAKFTADIKQLKPDTLIIEMPILDPESRDMVLSFIEQSEAERTVVVFGFSRSADVELLQARGVKVVRAPADNNEIFAAVLSFSASHARHVLTEAPPSRPAEQVPQEIPSRRFGPTELARLATASSDLQCECPHHLVDIVQSLSSFEAYSAACENRNESDARLHAELHALTAKARSVMEGALEKVAREEGLL
jgi:DNA-binding transcriptional MerR regulator